VCIEDAQDLVQPHLLGATDPFIVCQLFVNDVYFSQTETVGPSGFRTGQGLACSFLTERAIVPMTSAVSAFRDSFACSALITLRVRCRCG
jgi:hypothetical protein